GVAEKALKDAQDKEKARLAAESARMQTQGQLDMTADQLRQTNSDLVEALKEANDDKEKAKQSEAHALASAQAAIAAEQEAESQKQIALKAKAEAEAAEAKEKERAKKLEDQLGSPIADTLK